MISGVPIEVELAADVSKRELTFYGAQIGNRDGQNMRCMPGCFASSINTRLPRGLIKLCRNHEDRNSGVIRHAEEDSYGLLVVGKVSKTQAGDELLEQVSDGSLTHCSFRGSVVRGQWVIDGQDEFGHPIETLNLMEIKLKETGPVDFDPANMGATVISVAKSLGADLLDDLRELPLLLRFMTVQRERPLTADERRLAKGLVQLRKALDEHGGLIEALLAPGNTTPPSAAPVHPTQVAVEQADLAGMEVALRLIRQRGQLQP